MSAFMVAQLEYDPVHSNKTALVLYRTKRDAQDRGDNWLLKFDLTNEQLSELVVMQNIKVINTNA